MPSWASITITTADRRNATHPHAVLFTGRPHITALRPLPTAPHACTAGGPAALTECPRDGADFAVVGQGLLGLGAATITAGTLQCPNVTAYNSTYLTCHGLRGRGVGLPVVVATQGRPSVPRPDVALSYRNPCEDRHGPCSHHGICTLSLTDFCECYEDPLNGYWGGSQCTDCLHGYYGPTCTAVCPGGPCTPCTGHGDCDGGMGGTGTCRCWASAVQGHWVGGECGECAPGYYGVACALQCPGSGGVCSGHGRCADGLEGTGLCACDGNATAGYWAGAGCAECHAGYYGAECRASCPKTDGVACSGHGHCEAGPEGTARCACGPGFTGPVCAVPCPGGAAPCGGHGACGTAPDGAAQCACDPGWAAPGCVNCAPGHAGPDCGRRCPAHCGGHGACATGTTAGGECECVRGWAGAQCTVECPGGAAMVCSGHGVCLRDGTCECARSVASGFWAGAECLECAAGHAAPDCLYRCPVGPAGGVCSDRGECRAGRCACDAGACGRACEHRGAVCAAIQCPDPTHFGPACVAACPRNALGLVCGGHGLCEAGRNGTGLCLCAGAWSGPECDVPCPGVPHVCSSHGFCHAGTRGCACVSGFVGPDCGLQCPGGWQTPCGGHGVCNASANCTCDAGYDGAACEWECPGGHAHPCNGHGQCLGTLSATGISCTCDGHWGGAACGACAPGWHGPDCGSWCHRGVTQGTDCACESGWAGPDCTIMCPGVVGAVCGGHGTCNDTRRGDGTCACDAGWRGPACTVPCTGLLAYGEPCNGHGQCLANATCACAASRAAGHWNGSACTECAVGWFGPACDRTCPKGAGSAQVCGGHGWCREATEMCVCARDPDSGFWDLQSNCTECEPQYYGPACRGVCPGGACGACSGHGACDAGRSGSGACTCAPHWRGAACEECTAGRYGAECEEQCPAGARPGDGQTCSGHGHCSDGVQGTGECACGRSATGGFWEGDACDECLEGYFGPNCTGACPGPAGRPCHAPHGACLDGRNGTGVCMCPPGYGGVACALQCPTTTGEPCNGHGACGDRGGALVCDCAAAPYGHWEGLACERCAGAWRGPLCNLPCPVSAVGEVCAGHGECAMANASAAECACDSDYGGLACDIACPGGIMFACSGHGLCDALTATCACFSDLERGFWVGPACSACAPGWSGPLCAIACPSGAGGLPCSGAGVCYDGWCVCAPGRCGRACDARAPQCGLLGCPDGRYGFNCSRTCPGGAARPCAGHGTCQATVYSAGTCHCDAGYAGADCALLCPGGPARPCAGHGACGQADGRCTCHPTYAGPDCGVRCPITDGHVCSGHGACSGTATGDGTCACADGFGLDNCSVPCPRAPGNASRPCGAHGQCDPRTATCACAPSWAGPTCDVCAGGWHGPACATLCVHGVTQGRTCECHRGFGGANCSRECPGPADNRCYGHGQCRDGNTGDGRCACDPEWYGPDCLVFCRPSLCFPDGAPAAAAPRLTPHAQCNAATGACECQDDRFGHWAGPWCTECRAGYWGQECELLCQCSMHGTCGWLDGVCQCYADADRGYWTGEHCTDCIEGYLAPTCRVRDVAISRTQEALAPILTLDGLSGAVILVDVPHALTYAGGQPLWVLPSAGGPPVATMDLGGPVQSGSVLYDGIVLLVQDAGSGTTSMVKISRGPDPVLLHSVGTAVAAGGPRYRVQAVAGTHFSGVYEARGHTYWATVALDGAFHVIRYSSRSDEWRDWEGNGGAEL